MAENNLEILWACDLCGFDHNPQDQDSCDACGYVDNEDVSIPDFLERCGIKTEENK